MHRLRSGNQFCKEGASVSNDQLGFYLACMKGFGSNMNEESLIHFIVEIVFCSVLTYYQSDNGTYKNGE